MSQVWPLPFSVPDDVVEKAREIKLLVLDVDGVLTDGTLTYGPEGGDYKTFNTRDGQGIKSLSECGVDTAVISARSSRALTTRVQELGIQNVRTGVSDKLEAFESLLARSAIQADQCCYIGDDLGDIPVMQRCTLGIAVADAHYTVRHVAQWVTPSGGGRGAVREACDAILYAQQKFDDMMDQYTK
jgi:3-deoxy-D-manno-octulosonate 8-phosphate phosphatase (KDO 8-P phosphatase)